MCAATLKPTGIAYPFMSAARAENTPQNCLSKGVEVVTCEVRSESASDKRKHSER